MAAYLLDFPQRTLQSTIGNSMHEPYILLGLPWTAWLLLIASGGVGLSIVLLFYFSHRRGGRAVSPPADQSE